MRSLWLVLGTLMASWMIAQPAQAHFLWLVTEPGEDASVVKLYFSEAASPDDPDLLDRVQNPQAWVMNGRRQRDGSRGEPAQLKFQKEDDALVAALPEGAGSAPVALRHTYGVIRRGGKSFLLNYYAKTYPSLLPGSWRAIDDKERLPLEIAPRQDGDDLLLEVRWQGEPVGGAEVNVEGPGIEDALTGTTDEQGVYRCTLNKAGLFSVRARKIEEQAGEREGEKYDSVRHYSTLSLRYAPATVASAKHNWPALPRATTSFGGAVIGDWLYVYGGHYGQAHHYSQEGQSGDFQRLNLREGDKWETLPGGPKLTGLALVAHDGKLYRVGGFTAKNKDDEDESLWSQDDFARFNPQTGKWEQLPALPEGRSSLDAAVVGDVLYVVGGWEMRDGEEARWHDTACSVDLSSDKLQWKLIAKPPLNRRALALAAWNDKLYVLGGMQQEGGPTTQVDVYDPAKDRWSQGPELLGGGMEGFGVAAFACDGKLYATTMSGSIQQLSSDGGRWHYQGQLSHPRFFHRVLPLKNKNLVIVGGASMAAGKIEALERLPVTEKDKR